MINRIKQPLLRRSLFKLTLLTSRSAVTRAFYLGPLLALLLWPELPMAQEEQGSATASVIEKNHEERARHHDEEKHDEKEHNEQGHDEKEHDEQGHDEEGHDEHEEEVLSFSAKEMEEFGITLAPAAPGMIATSETLSGEVVVAPDRLYHVVPRVPGVVRKVFKQLGDEVKKGDLLATLSSRELAEAKAQLVAFSSRLRLADATLKREYGLYQKKVTAESEYLVAKQAQTEIAIERKTAQQRLLALGLSAKQVTAVLRAKSGDLTLYELRAPADGVIIGQHAVHGELLDLQTRAFTIADLSQVWVNLTLYQKELPLVHQGQMVHIAARFDPTGAEGVIDWISPTLEESTRSATARVVLDNRSRRWRPGMFVDGNVVLSRAAAPIVVPRVALQTVENQTVLFVQEGDAFVPRPVEIGRSDDDQVEIVSGLRAGERYVKTNAFTLKAHLAKGAFGEGHSH